MINTITKLVICAFVVTASAVYAQPAESCSSAKAESASSCCSAKAGDAQAPAATDPHAAHGDPAEAAADPHAEHQTGAAAPEAHGEHTMPSCCSGGGKMGMQRGGQGRGAVMPDAMQLLHNHTALSRTVEEIPNGVKTVTTTADPEILALLRRHAREMYAFYEAGGVVRPHDPLFAELARVADKVTMEFRDIENGIETIATSDDPEVVKVIRAHAAKVTEFVKRGHAALK